MAFDVSTLTAYTDQQRYPLVTKSLFGAKTQSLMNIQTGVRKTASINSLETDAVFQANSCGWNASGTTALTQRNITVDHIAVMEALCMKTLESYYIQTQLKAGTRHEDVPFEEIYSSYKAGKIAEQLETAVWQGDTASGSANLNKFDGLLKLIDAASGVVDATAETDVDATTIRGILEDVFGLLPSGLIDKDDVYTFMGWDNFRTLILKLTADNLFHYSTDEAARTGEIYYPGTNLRIAAVHGLNGTDRIITARASNLYFGTDLEREEEQFRIWYSEDNRETRFLAEFKAGVQIAHPTEIVSYQNI